MRRLFIIFFLTFSSICCSSQVNFIFMADLYGRNIDGLGKFQIQNLSGQSITGRVQITVKENHSKMSVVTINTLNATIPTGNSFFPSNAYINGNFQFSANAFGNIVSQTKNFPPGDYSFCFEFIDGRHSQGPDDCEEATIEPIVPMNLLIPSDDDHICEKRPSLSWQPPIPYSPAIKFRLLLTEKREGASVENLMMNAPLIFLDNIPSTSIMYPASAPSLVEGKTYCWQVIAFQQGVIVSSSEIWQFTVQCTDSTSGTGLDSYRELKLLVNGNYYIALGSLKFSFQNNYNVSKLSYEIDDIENGVKIIRNTPSVSIKTGYNKIDIDLSDLGLVVGQHYLLKVHPFNEPELLVKFIYQENNSSNNP